VASIRRMTLPEPQAGQQRVTLPNLSTLAAGGISQRQSRKLTVLKKTRRSRRGQDCSSLDQGGRKKGVV